MASAHRRILVHRRITVTEDLNIPHTVFDDGAAPHNVPCLLLHGFGGLVVVDATVMSMCCFPDKVFHMRNPLGVHLTSMTVLGKHMVVDDQPCQHINAHTQSRKLCKSTLLPCDVKADRHVDARTLWTTIQSFPQLWICVGVGLV